MTDGAPIRSLKGRSSADTRSAVLDLIRSSGSISRTELAVRSSLTEATISKIVKQLLADGILIEAGRAESTGGKRPTLLTLNTGQLYAIGVSLERARTVVVLCGLNGTMLDRFDADGAGADTPPEVIERVGSAVDGLLGSRGIDRRSIVGIGVSTTGRRLGSLGWYFDPTETELWERFDTARELEVLTGIPVIVENDANCVALGTFWAQTGDTARNFITVYMSQGIGAGIVLGGALHRGASGNAGEVGHIVVEPQGLSCWCGSRGCLETVGGPRGIVRQARLNEALTASYGLDPAVEDAEAYARLLAGVQDGDPKLVVLFERSAEYVASMLRGLMNVFDVDRIYLAGPGFDSVGGQYLERAGEALRSSFTQGLRPSEVVLSAVGTEVAALGAASVVLHSNLTPHLDAPRP